MTTIIHLQRPLTDEAKKNKVLPSGWYSQSQEGAHESQHIRLEWEGNDKNNKPAIDFTYWHDERILVEGERIW